MADPANKKPAWSQAYPAYAEKHDMYRVFQELLKELIIFKPDDPLAYIRDEISNVAAQLHVPRVFLIGPNVTAQGIGRRLSTETGAKYLTLPDIVETAPKAIRGVLAEYVQGCHDEPRFDDSIRKVLVATIILRLRHTDCHKNGYILYGFPQTKQQAICAQQAGLLPRQVFVLLPEQTSATTDNSKNARSSLKSNAPDYQEFGEGLLKVSSHVTLPDIVDYVHVKAIADCYDYEVCKVYSYDKWNSTKKIDIEDQLLASMVTVKPCGSSPWIPKILLFGPPYSGKNSVAEALAAKFGFVSVDFLEAVRGASRMKDDVGVACKKYLKDLSPQALPDDVLKDLLRRVLYKDECTKKGWILHGFPDTINQLKCLEAVHSYPNRVFYLACTEDMARRRMLAKREEILGRKLQGAQKVNLAKTLDENNFEEFPYGKIVFRKRTEMFNDNFSKISKSFGRKMIYVDGTQSQSHILSFVEESILRPPVIRYAEPYPS